MSRDDLLSTNARIVTSVGEQIKQTSPNAVVIVVSNPLDAMVQQMWKVTGFDKSRFADRPVYSTLRDTGHS